MLDLTGGQIAEAAALLRQSGVETEETLRQEYLRPDKPRGGMPAERSAAEVARRASGNGSPDDEEN